MQVTGPAALDVFLGQKPGLVIRYLVVLEEFTIKMGNIIKKWLTRPQQSLLAQYFPVCIYDNIFGEFSITVQTNFLVTFFAGGTPVKFCLKIRKERYLQKNLDILYMENKHLFVSSSMKTTILILLIGSFIISAQGQHYYNDLVATYEQMKKRAVWLQQRIRSMRFSSLDGNNQPIEGFNVNKM